MSQIAEQTTVELTAQHQHCIDVGWKPGTSGNPKGRPKGSRNAVSESFLQDIHKVWSEATTDDKGLASTNGLDVIRAVAANEPAKLLAAMVQILPKNFELDMGEAEVKWVISAQPALDADEWASNAQKRLQDDSDTKAIDGQGEAE